MRKTQSLSPEIIHILHHKGTEAPFSGEYTDTDELGTYLCRQCGLALFRAQHKFHSGCGWASFDQEIPDVIIQRLDSDNQRIEILCARCNGHLGHLFRGEGFTKKNARYCVNSLSLDFVADLMVQDTEEAIFAAGCFWGVEYYFKRLLGVIKTEVGYTGGHKTRPSYKEISQGDTGHYEAIRIIYDPNKISYQKLVQYFFEIHDPTQVDGQGPDRAERYMSVIFYYDATQQEIALKLMNRLTDLGYKLTTKLVPVTIFWNAEEYHQNYYTKINQEPYCHHYTKRF